MYAYFAKIINIFLVFIFNILNKELFDSDVIGDWWIYVSIGGVYLFIVIVSIGFIITKLRHELKAVQVGEEAVKKEFDQNSKKLISLL